MARLAFAKFSSLAERDSGESRFEPPAKRSTLKLSRGCRVPRSCLIRVLETSSGKPAIDHENVIPPWQLRRRYAPWRLHGQQEEVLLLALGEEQARFNSRIREAIFQ